MLSLRLASVQLCDVVLHNQSVGRSISQSVIRQASRYNYLSHLGLIKCLTLIIAVSSQHDVQTFTEAWEQSQYGTDQEKCIYVVTANNPGEYLSLKDCR